MKMSLIMIAGLFCLAVRTQGAAAPTDPLNLAFAAAERATNSSVARSALVPAQPTASAVVCTATCLIGNNYRHLVQSTGKTRVDAMIKLKAACDQKLETYNTKQSELVTSINFSNGSSWMSAGNYKNTEFDINKACTN